MNILILDDNNLICMMVEKNIRELDIEGTIHIANSYVEGKQILSQTEIDIAFLDIEIDEEHPEKNGLIFAKELNMIYPSTMIIFISSYPAYALKAYDVHPFDFIVKPVDIERLRTSAKKAFSEINRQKFNQQEQTLISQKDRLFIKTSREIFFINYADIYYIEKVNKEVVIHTTSETHTVRWTLSEMETMLPSDFIRVHKSYLVNASKVTRISEFGDRSYEIFFGNLNKTAMLSRYKVNDLLRAMDVPN